MDEELKALKERQQIKDDIFDRLYQEIKNITLAEAYLGVEDLVGQNEFARRVKVDGGRLSMRIAKLKQQKEDSASE